MVVNIHNSMHNNRTDLVYRQKHGTVVVVDPDPTICNVTALMIERLGYSTVMCEPIRLRDFVQQHKQAISIICFGLSLAESLSENTCITLLATLPSSSNVRIVLMTSVDTAQLRRLYRGVGICILPKPFGLVELGRALDE